MAERKEKLEELLARLKRGGIVQNRDLRTWLGEEAYAVYEAEWAEQLEIRAMLKDKPVDIREYEKLLKQAQIFENRADAAVAGGRKQTAYTLRARAQQGYERALEFLIEARSADLSLDGWIDRSCDWTAESFPTLCAEDMPRAVTTRREGSGGGGWRLAILSKRKIKIRNLEQEIAALDC